MAIGVTEMAYQTKYIDTYTFRGVEVLVASSVLYICVCLVIEAIGLIIHRLFSRHLDTHRVVQAALVSE
jgi:ABC-type amino acid transport system permease subunit